MSHQPSHTKGVEAAKSMTVRQENGAGVLTIQTASLGDRSAVPLRVHLREAIANNQGRVVVDFSGVIDVSPACITALMESSVSCSTRGGRLMLARVPAGLARVIQLAGLQSALPAVSNVEVALQLVARAKWTWLGPIGEVA